MLIPIIYRPAILLFAIAQCTGIARAEFETWKSADGRSAEMELVEKQESGGTVTGIFRLKDGRKVSLEAGKLAPEDATKLKERTLPAPVAAGAKSPATESEIAKMVGKDLKQANGKRLSKGELTKAAEYYVLYDSASWCGPCRKITPKLVKLYADKIKDHPKFEFILLSHDEEKEAMEQYVKDDKMEWLVAPNDSGAYKKLASITNASGIPKLTVVKPDGSVVFSGHPGGNLAELEKLLDSTK